MDNPNQKYFDYLHALRDSGQTNMTGAGTYLQDQFDLSTSQARDILLEWIRTFKA